MPEGVAARKHRKRLRHQQHAVQGGNDIELPEKKQVFGSRTPHPGRHILEGRRKIRNPFAAADEHGREHIGPDPRIGVVIKTRIDEQTVAAAATEGAEKRGDHMRVMLVFEGMHHKIFGWQPNQAAKHGTLTAAKSISRFELSGKPGQQEIMQAQVAAHLGQQAAQAQNHLPDDVTVFFAVEAPGENRYGGLG